VNKSSPTIEWTEANGTEELLIMLDKIDDSLTTIKNVLLFFAFLVIVWLAWSILSAVIG